MRLSAFAVSNTVGVAEEAVAPLVILRLGYAVLGAQLADRPSSKAFEDDERFLLWAPLQSFHA